MFMGEYHHNIDSKGRITLPAKFRETFGTSVVINRGFEGCLNVYSYEQWQKIYQKLISIPLNKKESRTFIRLFLSKAQELELDKLGRINIPKNLIEIVDITRECVIVGAGDHLEIWNAKTWDIYYEQEKDNFENISEFLYDF